MEENTTMQSVREKLSEAIEKTLGKLGIEAPGFSLEHPQDETYGDFSTNAAFLAGKKLGKPPLHLAEELKENFPSLDFISDVSVAKPGFLNFRVKSEVVASELLDILRLQEKYGSNSKGKGKKWLLEHTSPNPNKAMHIGHLRNNVIGMALAKIWEFSGIKVTLDCIDNNRGIAIAKLMWGFLQFARKTPAGTATIDSWFSHQDDWHTPESEGMRPDRFVDDLYVKGEKDFSENEESAKAVRKIVVDWEAHDKKVWALWEHVLKYSYEGQSRTLARLMSRWDKVWHEHEHYEKGKEFVERGLREGIFRKLEDGAVLTDLESKYGIADTILMKSDGTALYITQDLALTELKHDAFDAGKMFWLIGPEQSLAMRQMFAACDQLGINRYDDCIHLSYGRMNIKGQGKMSSRLGNVIYIDDLIDLAKEEIMKRMDDSQFSKEEAESIAEKVAVGAVKYSILKVGRTMNMEFDIESSIAFEGNSGPYIQYTCVRTQSLLKKLEEEVDFKKIVIPDSLNIEEESLLRYLYRFGETVLESTESYSPHFVCTYLHELSKRYNALYNEHMILREPDEKMRHFRILLTAATGQILRNGLTVLNIEVPERM